MKLLIISDTHGYIVNARKAIDRNPDIRMVLHLGDLIKDAVELSKIYPNIQFEYVSGNCDMAGNGVPSEKTIEVEGKRIFMTHGHKYFVKWDLNALLVKAQQEKADIALFGHTHMSMLDWVNNIWFLNPGSISQSRNTAGESYAILDTSDSELRPEICNL